MILTLVVALQVAVPGAQGTAIKLVDVAASAGVDLLNISGGPAKDYIVDANGNGAAFLDYDNDGDLDVLIVNGSDRQRFATGGDPMIALYQNTGKGAFKDVTASSGFDRRGWGSGVASRTTTTTASRTCTSRHSALMPCGEIPGRVQFVDVTRRAGVEESRWGTSCAFADYDRDGRVIFMWPTTSRFDERVIPGRGTTANCRFMATDVFCGPKQLTGDRDVLYRNNGDGTFADVTDRAGTIDLATTGSAWSSPI